MEKAIDTQPTANPSQQEFSLSITVTPLFHFDRGTNNRSALIHPKLLLIL